MSKNDTYTTKSHKRLLITGPVPTDAILTALATEHFTMPTTDSETKIENMIAQLPPATKSAIETFRTSTIDALAATTQAIPDEETMHKGTIKPHWTWDEVTRQPLHFNLHYDPRTTHGQRSTPETETEAIEWARHKLTRIGHIIHPTDKKRTLTPQEFKRAHPTLDPTYYTTLLDAIHPTWHRTIKTGPPTRRSPMHEQHEDEEWHTVPGNAYQRTILVIPEKGPTKLLRTIHRPHPHNLTLTAHDPADEHLICTDPPPHTRASALALAMPNSDTPPPPLEDQRP